MYISIPMMDIWQKIEILQIQDGGRTPYWKSFLLYLGALLADQREIRKGDEESHTNTGHMTKTAIFENSRWRKDAISKKPYLNISAVNCPIFIKFGTKVQISIPSMEFDKKSKFFNFNMADVIDIVDHNILLTKLKDHGIPHCLVKWFHSYLRLRRQTVSVDNQYSDWLYITAGMLQGLP